MKKFLILTILSFTQVYALDILCVDTDLMDSQFTAHFYKDLQGKFSVTIEIPTGETSVAEAQGKCIFEEDTNQLNLSCDKIKTDNDDLYFVRTDGKKATIILRGEIIASIPCSSQEELDGRELLLNGEYVLVDRGRYCDKKVSYDQNENIIYEVSHSTLKGLFNSRCARTAGLKVRKYKCSGEMYDCKWKDYINNSRGSYIETHSVNINSKVMQLIGKIKFTSCRSNSCIGSRKTFEWNLILDY